MKSIIIPLFLFYKKGKTFFPYSCLLKYLLKTEIYLARKFSQNKYEISLHY